MLMLVGRQTALGAARGYAHLHKGVCSLAHKDAQEKVSSYNPITGAEKEMFLITEVAVHTPAPLGPVSKLLFCAHICHLLPVA